MTNVHDKIIKIKIIKIKTENIKIKVNSKL